MMTPPSHSSYFPEETETRLWCSLHLSPFDYSFIFLILTTHTESRHAASSYGMMYDPQTAVISGQEEYREVCIKGLQRPLSVFGRRLSRFCNLCLATSGLLFFLSSRIIKSKRMRKCRRLCRIFWGGGTMHFCPVVFLTPRTFMRRLSDSRRPVRPAAVHSSSVSVELARMWGWAGPIALRDRFAEKARPEDKEEAVVQVLSACITVRLTEEKP